ncbi:MAG: hypothetical protein HC824_15555 [Synechococcales cyanobacterium RM1_1_8]|nr:hypothetical protein [Synechococcales cyanobacterium RM1_1_8]
MSSDPRSTRPPRPAQPNRLRLRPWLRAALKPPAQATAGVTLLEALVAMILITIVVTIITPPIFMAVATRVSNRRTEQAMQLGQSEIERVRLLMSSGLSDADITPLLPPEVSGITPDNIATVPAPTATCGELPPCGNANQVALTFKPADATVTDDRGQRLFVQSFRDPGERIGNPATGPLFAFRMGVRVYGAEAMDATGTPKAGLETQPRALSFTTGTGSRGVAPLAVFYTELNRGSSTGGLPALKDYSGR